MTTLNEVNYINTSCNDGIVIFTGCFNFFLGGCGASAISAAFGLTSSSNSSSSTSEFTSADSWLGVGKSK